MPELPEIKSKSPEWRLTNAWIANRCGDSTCELRRLEAAIKVLYGDKTHSYYVKVIENTTKEEDFEGVGRLKQEDEQRYWFYDYLCDNCKARISKAASH